MPSDPVTRLTIDFIPASRITPVVTVAESSTLDAARTLMELYDFSQLPVVRGRNGRSVGVVSWETIGKALLRDRQAGLADCIQSDIGTVQLGSDLLAAIPSINRDGYVLVTDATRVLTGIVTSADLGDALADVAKPYLAIAECERLLRSLIQLCIDRGELDPRDLQSEFAKRQRSPEGGPNDLTLGESVAAVTSERVWSIVGEGYDLTAMRRYLGRVVEIRNQVMHFRHQDDDASVVIERVVVVLSELEQRARR